MSSQVQQEEERQQVLELAEREFWGVFDKDDLEIAQMPLQGIAADLARPAPIALFESEEEAKGFILLTGVGDALPVIRRCMVRGTVQLAHTDVARSEQ